MSDKEFVDGVESLIGSILLFIIGYVASFFSGGIRTSAMGQILMFIATFLFAFGLEEIVRNLLLDCTKINKNIIEKSSCVFGILLFLGMAYLLVTFFFY